MANIAPNITSVGISCAPPPPAPPGEGAIAHATSGKKGFIGPSGYPIVREKPSPEGVERAADDRLAHRRHEAEVEAHVVQREQPVREQLLRHEEMAEIRAREGATRVTVTDGVERAALTDPLRLFDRHRSARRERLSVARIARRQHAVEHVDAARDRLHEVLRLANTHEIPRAVGGQRGRHARGELEHRRLGLADGEAADGVAVEAEGHRALDGLRSELVERSTLADAEQRLAA